MEPITARYKGMVGIMNYVITTMQPTSLYKSPSPFFICYLTARGYAAAAAAAATTIRHRYLLGIWKPHTLSNEWEYQSILKGPGGRRAASVKSSRRGGLKTLRSVN